MKNNDELALEYHRSFPAGKIGIIPTKPASSQEDLSLAYTPGVAAPSLAIADNPETAYDYTGKGNLVAVISNGTAVLGLGDIGALSGKPVMEGKGLLFKIYAGIDVFDIEVNEKDPDKFVEAVKAIAPTFGVENMLGTNPLTFGCPTDEEFPFVFDAATSVSQRGKIEVYAREGKDVPPGWVIDEEGTTRTDTETILDDLTKGKAALAPLGGIGTDGAGYKGYGFATVVEILSSALQKGSFLKDLNGKDENGNNRPYHLGHFFIAINPDFFMGEDTFRHIAGEILRELRNSKKAPGEERIWTAGELEWTNWQIRKETGCPIPAELQKQISELTRKFSLSFLWPWD